MTTSSRWFTALGLFSAAPVFAAQFIAPEPLPAGRYDKMVEEWPFALATPAAAPVAEAAPGFSVNLHIMAISRERLPDGTERDVVLVKSQADQSVMRLIGNEPKEGISVAGVEWSERVGKTVVTLKKGSEFAPVKFDEALVHGAGQGAMPAGVPPRPGAPPNAFPQPRPGFPASALPTSLPPGNNGQPIAGPRNQNRIQPVIPRPNSVAPVLNLPQPGAIPQALPGP